MPLLKVVINKRIIYLRAFFTKEAFCKESLYPPSKITHNISQIEGRAGVPNLCNVKSDNYAQNLGQAIR
jgi:hypothetical protein